MLTRILFCFWFSTYPLEFIYFCRSNDIDPVLVSRTCSHKRIVNRSINVLPPSLFFPLSSTILSLLGRKWELGDPLETNLIKDRRTRTFNFNFRQPPPPPTEPSPSHQWQDMEQWYRKSAIHLCWCWTVRPSLLFVWCLFEIIVWPSNRRSTHSPVPTVFVLSFVFPVPRIPFTIGNNSIPFNTSSITSFVTSFLKFSLF